MNPTLSLSRPGRSALSWLALQAVVDLLRRGRDAWRRQSEARQTHLALRDLDERSLRDLGFDRSELGSLVAEIDGQAAPTRVRVLQAYHGLRI
ncbi:MAG: hypothetical protein V4792_06165 [Pseudomonadota bacterium]